MKNNAESQNGVPGSSWMIVCSAANTGPDYSKLCYWNRDKINHRYIIKVDLGTKIKVYKYNINNDKWKQICGYCWTHGGSHSHWSGNCEDPKQGHQRNATFANQLGGSTRWNDKEGHWLRMRDHHIQEQMPQKKQE